MELLKYVQDRDETLQMNPSLPNSVHSRLHKHCFSTGRLGAAKLAEDRMMRQTKVLKQGL